MNFSHFFISRPIFAAVISIVIMIVGGIAYFTLPISQYPEVAPPTVVVTTSYPGANPEVISETVATPLEQAINGVEDMLYLTSQCTTDGAMTLTITFKLGTDLDKAQVLVQNRVATAVPRLPEEVQRIGVTTDKSSPDLLLVVHLLSPNKRYDQLYISNYATLHVIDVLRRLDGVGSVGAFGGREYSMRIWLDPEKLSSVNLTAADVVAALREQNVQVAAGVIGQQPVGPGHAFQLSVNTLGRLIEPAQFGEIVIKTGDDGRVVRVRDIARVELGGLDYSVNSYLGFPNEKEATQAVALAIQQRPGSNAIATAHAVRATIDRLSKDFPKGLEYRVIYDPTVFVEESVNAVFHTIFEAVILVVLVVMIFLQSWRATVIPLVAIPVSLIGTFAAMSALGFSLNNLSLFGLVLAIGIVVDDAIVVVENIERNLEENAPEPNESPGARPSVVASSPGAEENLAMTEHRAPGVPRPALTPADAARKAMDEVGGPVVSVALVLAAVFIPTAFISGISGQFYRQFALTIAVSTVISAFVSLTLSPALGAILLRPRGAKKDWFTRLIDKVFGWLFRGFNKFFEKTIGVYVPTVGRLVRRSGLALIVYALLLVLTFFAFKRVPVGFIPALDQGYAVIAIQLPDGASLERTDQVIRQVIGIALKSPGIDRVVAFAGFSGATRANSSNAAALFPGFAPFDKRGRKLDGPAVIAGLRQRLAVVQGAQVAVIPPPPVRGLGTGGGFKMEVQDRSGAGLRALQAATDKVIQAARGDAGLVQVFTQFRASTPQLFAEVDRTKAKMLNVPLGNIFDTLQIYLGSTFVNEFNLFGRTYRVTAQADSQFRDDVSDIARLKTRNSNGGIVPLGSVMNIKETTGPDRVVRYNLFPAAEINGDTAKGFSSGQSLDTMERLAHENLPNGMNFEWTDLAFQQRAAGNTAVFIFPLCVLFVFLTLAAQYESWTLPLAVILIVPMCLLSAIGGVMLRGFDNNILTQIGFVVLVGLASKNAILIVEFARQQEHAGKNRFEAAIEACRLRLRPILMTSFAFILGVVPLVIASGAGAEMRQSLGTAVFFGMLGVTFFGLLLTPIFYVVIRGFASDTVERDALSSRVSTPLRHEPDEQSSR